MDGFGSFIAGNKSIVTESESKNHNILVFAFVGDAVFSVYVRTFLACKSTSKVGVLHTLSSRFVRASYQGKLLETIEKNLTEQEKEIANTARNTKTKNKAKNSDAEEYKKSTSFEALLGFLYMTNQNARLYEILELCKVEMEKES